MNMRRYLCFRQRRGRGRSSRQQQQPAHLVPRTILSLGERTPEAIPLTFSNPRDTSFGEDFPTQNQAGNLVFVSAIPIVDTAHQQQQRPALPQRQRREENTAAPPPTRRVPVGRRQPLWRGRLRIRQRRRTMLKPSNPEPPQMPTATLVPPTENSHHRHGLQEEENAPVPDSPVRQRTTAEDTDATLGIQPRPRRPHDPNTTTSSSSSSFPSSPILLSAHQQSELARFLGEHGIAMGTLLASLNEGGEGGDSPTPAITSTGNTTTTTTTPCDEIRILDVEMSQGHQGLLRILSELTIPFELSQPPPIRMPTIGDDDNILLGDDIMENTGGGGGEEENEEHHFISNNRFSREDYIDDDDQLSGLIAQLDAAAAAAPQTNAALQKEDSMQRLIKAIRCMEKQPTSMTPSEADRLTGVLEEQYAAFDQTKAFSSSSYSSLALAPSSLR